MLTLIEALSKQRVCGCDCHRKLTPEERTRGVEALYFCDDVLRGWKYEPIYELHGDLLWKAAQQKGDPNYRGIAVRFGECMYKRLVGSMLHEMLHALHGDVARANYGIPFGLPYGVPEDLPPSEEEKFLARFNAGEARAFVGVWILGKELFAIDWSLRTARDVGTYALLGGNALVAVPHGFRPVAHLDRRHHEARYYARARALEDEAKAELTRPEVLAALVARVRAAAEEGRARGPKRPPARDFGRMAPKRTLSNDPCTCGSSQPYKECCARGAGQPIPLLAR
ncbi:MAG TPA: SEC-C metal-binding domain-containing protein [Polyangiaceae bacterium]